MITLEPVNLTLRRQGLLLWANESNQTTTYYNYDYHKYKYYDSLQLYHECYDCIIHLLPNIWEGYNSKHSTWQTLRGCVGVQNITNVGFN